MVVSSKCAEPRPKKTDARTQFVFLGRSAAGHRMTAKYELEQTSFKYTGVEEAIILNVSATIGMSLDA